MNPSMENNWFTFDILGASKILSSVTHRTPLEYSKYFSDYFGAEVFFKREDIQITNSYKIRWAYNAIFSLFGEEGGEERKIVCASAWNHSQWVAYVCRLLGVDGTIYMPKNTPPLKVLKTKEYGWANISIILEGNCFDDAEELAMRYSKENNLAFIHPFNNHHVIEGQGTVGYEILQDWDNPSDIDTIVVPIWGWWLISGIIQSLKTAWSNINIIGVQPLWASSMKLSLDFWRKIKLDTIDTFIDGASVKSPWEIPFSICDKYGVQVISVDNNSVINATRLLHANWIYAELAAWMSLAAMEKLKPTFNWKTVVIIISWWNYDKEKLFG